MIEIEVQNETHQSQERLRFAAVPRIGEGLRLREPDGCWASYDVLDVWYQKAEYGDVWIPFLHVCMTVGENAAPPPPAEPAYEPTPPVYEVPRPRPQAVPQFASLTPQQEVAQCRT